MAPPIKRLKPGEKLKIETASGIDYSLCIENIVTDFNGYKRVIVDLGSSQNIFRLLQEIGSAPLPPYINRDPSPMQDQKRLLDLCYQTVYARAPGAVAAPTAGLHFSEALLAQIREAGIEICPITLHVGPGTFKPISTSIEEHRIEPETFYISEKTALSITKAKSEGRRIIAVGTTSLRALESAAFETTSGNSGLLPINGEQTTLYIQPRYKFKIVDALITNFHLSRSSLLVLVSSFAGHELTMKAYECAVQSMYRFYSYGDAMLIL